MTAELRVLTAEPLGEGIVELLERYLEDAKAGKLSSLAIAAVDREGCMDCGWSLAPPAGLLMGAIARLQHLYNRRQDER